MVANMHHLKSSIDRFKKHNNHDSAQAPAIGTPDPKPEPAHSLIAVTQQAIDVFLASKQDNGEIGGLGYWQTANGYTAIALHDAWSGTTHNVSVLEGQIARVRKHRQGTFVNEFNDDSLWWANCLLDLHEVNHESDLVVAANRVWEHVSRSVVLQSQCIVQGMDMGGGVMWTTKSGDDQINAITSGLFAEVSARWLSSQGRMEDKKTF